MCVSTRNGQTDRKHPVDQVRGALGHPAPTTTRAEPAALAREPDEPIQAAGRAAKPREPAGQPAAAKERAKFVFHELRQACALAQARRLHAERLEVVVDNLVERAPGWMPGLVVEGRLGHAWRSITGRAFTGCATSGRIPRAHVFSCAECAYLSIHPTGRNRESRCPASPRQKSPRAAEGDPPCPKSTPRRARASSPGTTPLK